MSQAAMAAASRVGWDPTVPVWSGERGWRTVCFADLAGFTAMSEALGAFGTSGTERMVELINDIFGRALTDAVAAGGDLVGFGGDSLTIVFSGDEDGRRAAEDWATQLVARVAEYPDVMIENDARRIDVKVGVAQGELTTHVIGNSSRVEVTAGAGVDAAARAEAQAVAGQVVRSPDFTRPPPSRGLDPVVLTRPSPGDKPKLARLLPEALLGRLGDDLTGSVEEHRLVTTLFVGLPAQELDDDALHHMADVLNIIDRWHGTTISLGAGDKGLTILATFGAPIARPEQRIEALNAARSIAESGCRVGVTSGLVFCGRMGSNERWNYNMLGDTVNTAARLMTAALNGEVLVDPATRAQADLGARFGEPRSLELKGKAEPLDVATLLDLSRAQQSEFNEVPLVGRRHQLAVISSAISNLIAGTGSSIGIFGESGIGKSRLGRELRRSAEQQRIAWSEADVWHRRSGTSYGPLRSILLKVLDLAPTAGALEFRAAVADRLDDTSGGPSDLLTNLFFDSIGGDDVASLGLSAADAASRVDEAITRVILSTPEPMLVLIDDVQDLDEASARVVERLVTRASNSQIIVAVLGYPDAAAARLYFDHRFELGRLDDDDALSLLNNYLGRVWQNEDPERITRVVDRADGNPRMLFLLADAPRDESLPDDVRSLLQGRFDRLSPDQQRALSAAATLGRHFLVGEFVGAFSSHQQAETDAVRQVRSLLGQGLLEQGQGELVSFASPALQEVVYESAPHAARRANHETVGLYLESIPSRHIDELVERLAHHFMSASNAERERRYVPRAARKARRRFANERAITWFERSAEILDGADRHAVLFELGETLEHVGRPEEASNLFTSLIGESGQSTVGVRAMASLARLTLDTDGYEAAVSLLDEARKAARALPLDVQEWTLERASLLHTFAGRTERATVAAQAQLEIAQKLGDPIRVAAATSNLGAANYRNGDLDSGITLLSSSLAAALTHGALGIACDIEMDLAMATYLNGDGESALSQLDTARRRAEQIGYRRSQALIAGNSAYILVDLDQHDLALDRATEALESVTEAGDLDQGIGVLGIVGLALKPTRPREAMAFAARVGRLGRSLGSTLFREQAYELAGECHTLLGNDVAAQACGAQQAVADAAIGESEVDVSFPAIAVEELELDDRLRAALLAFDRLADQTINAAAAPTSANPRR